MPFLVYCIKNDADKVVYVGSTITSLARRKRGRYLFPKLPEYRWELLSEHESDLDMWAAESYYIRQFDTINDGLNKATGGPGMPGVRHSEATRAKYSADRTGRKLSPEHIAKVAAANTGKRHTPESKEKMRLASLGKTATPEARAKMSAARVGRKRKPETVRKMIENSTKVRGVVCVETGISFRSQGDAARAMNLDQRKISCVCLGKRKSTGGYTFKFTQPPN